MKTKPIFKTDEGKQKILQHYNSLLKQWTAVYKERYIETSYGNTFILEAGDENNPAVFLFHGSCTNSAMWFEDIKILMEQYHVFSVDILGEPGKSAENRLDVNSDDYAHWIKELMDKLDIQQAVFIGNSYGAWMALKFAINYPSMVSKLVLIAASGITPAKISFILKSIIYASQGEKGLRSLNQMVYGTDEIPQEVIEAGNLIMRNFNPYVGALPIFSDEQLKKLTMPVFYIAGENDVTVNTLKTAQRLKSLLPNAAADIIKDNGHVVFGVMNKVINFINK